MALKFHSIMEEGLKLNFIQFEGLLLAFEVVTEEKLVAG